jgi:hypothetical protein
LDTRAEGTSLGEWVAGGQWEKRALLARATCSTNAEGRGTEESPVRVAGERAGEGAEWRLQR